MWPPLSYFGHFLSDVYIHDANSLAAGFVSRSRSFSLTTESASGAHLMKRYVVRHSPRPQVA